MKTLLTIVFNALFYFLTLIFAIMGAFGSLLPGKYGHYVVRSAFQSWCHSMVFIVRHVLRTKIHVKGLENKPQTPVIFASKHQSELDVALLGTLIPNYGAIAMRELDNYPLIGRMVSHLGHIKVTTSGNAKKNQLPEVLEGVQTVYERGRPILIFPEGTLMRIGKKERYRNGVWHIYHKLNIPVIPIAHNLGSAWPRREWTKHIGRTITLEFMAPIETGMKRTAFMALLEKHIETQTNELIRENHTPEEVAEIEFEYELEAEQKSLEIVSKPNVALETAASTS